MVMSNCGTKHDNFVINFRPIGSPFSKILPSTGPRYRFEIAANKDVLPAPLEPRMATNWPDSMWPFTESSENWNKIITQSLKGNTVALTICQYFLFFSVSSALQIIKMGFLHLQIQIFPFQTQLFRHCMHNFTLTLIEICIHSETLHPWHHEHVQSRVEIWWNHFNLFYDASDKAPKLIIRLGK